MAVRWKYNQRLDPTWNRLHMLSTASGATSQGENYYTNTSTASRRAIAWAKERGAKYENGLLVEKKKKVRYKGKTKSTKPKSTASTGAGTSTPPNHPPYPGGTSTPPNRPPYAGG